LRHGPFTIAAARTFAETLERKKIPFEVEDNQEGLAELLQKWKGENQPFRRPIYDSAFIYFLTDEPIADLREPDFLSLDAEPDFLEEEFLRGRKLQKSRLSFKRGALMAFGGAIVFLVALEMILQEMSR
jgi:hypothetical protein